MERSAKSAHGALLLVAGALGFGALKTGIDDIVKAGTNYQEQQAQLQAALHSTHQASREHTKSLGETADKLSTTGGFSEPQNLQALTRLVTATGSVAKAQRDVGLATDIARRFHLPYLSSVRAVAMAESGRTTGLTRLGIVVKKGMTRQQALASLHDKTSGSMRAFSHTAAGAMSNATNAVDNAGRAISIGLLPYVTKLANWFAKNLPAAIHATIAVVKSVIGWFHQHKAAAEALKGALIILVGAFTAMFIISKVTALFIALDAAMAANPVSLIIIGVAALAAGFIYLYEKVGWFRHAVQAVFHWIIGHWQLLADILFGPFGFVVGKIITHLHGLLRFFKSVPRSITGFFSNLGGGIKSIFVDIVNFVVGLIRKMLSAINSIKITLPSILGVGGGTIGFNIPLPGLMAGGSHHARGGNPAQTPSVGRGLPPILPAPKAHGASVHTAAAYNGGDIHIHIAGHHFAKVTRREIQKAMMAGA